MEQGWSCEAMFAQRMSDIPTFSFKTDLEYLELNQYFFLTYWDGQYI